MPTYDAVLDFAPCHLGACFFGETLTRLDFLPKSQPFSHTHDSRALHLAHELQQYSDNPAHEFDLMFVPSGTPFQLRVWRALLGIPSGHVSTYGALAKQLGTAPRALGQACGTNPLPIIIPCHRIVAANGLGGFMHAAKGAPLDIKTWLLTHERGHAQTST
jgi:methylated-DNA-[protein]-cysteine S-methyltransferase